MQTREEVLAAWLQWCLDHCDDSPEWNYGTLAAGKIRGLLRGETVLTPEE